MLRQALTAAFALSLTAAPVWAMPIPDTLAAEIEILMPDTELEGADLNDEEIDALAAAVYGSEDPQSKTRRIEEILNAAMAD